MVHHITRLPTLLGRIVQTSRTITTGTRTFSSLPTLRPTLSSRPTRTTTTAFPTTTTSATTSLITSNPALGGLASQIRFGSRPTMEVSSRLKRKRQCGFVSRMKTAKGRKMIKRRLEKGRKRLGADA